MSVEGSVHVIQLNREAGNQTPVVFRARGGVTRKRGRICWMRRRVAKKSAVKA